MLAACSTGRAVTPISCPASVALVHEARLAKSVGAEMSRAELLREGINASEAHENLRLRFNSLVDDVRVCNTIN